MKTVSVRDFYHTPGLVRGLQPGESLTVTKAGKPDFIVTKTASPRRKLPVAKWREERDSIKVLKPFNVKEVLDDLRK
jgi:antitoxin (DNA-binding transcriptional repressor) of toxin-antitoxin stability system